MESGKENGRSVVGLMAAAFAIIGAFTTGVWSLFFVTGAQWKHEGANAAMGLIAAALSFGLAAQALWRR